MARTYSKTIGNYMSMGVAGIGNLINGNGAISVSAFVKPSSYDTGANDNRVLGVLIDGASSSGLILNIGGSPAKLTASARAVTADSLQSKAGTTTVATGSFVDVGAVYNFAAGTITPYLNGTAEGGGSVTFGATSWTKGSPTGIDMIGAAANAAVPFSTPVQFAGDIAELAIYGAALTSGNFADLAGGVYPSDVQAASLLGYWALAGTSSPEPSGVNGGLPAGTITGSLPQATHPAMHHPTVSTSSGLGVRMRAGLIAAAARRRRG